MKNEKLFKLSEKILNSEKPTDYQKHTLRFSLHLLDQGITIPGNFVEAIYDAGIVSNAISNSIPLIPKYTGTPNTNAFVKKLILAYKCEVLGVAPGDYSARELEEYYDLATNEIGRLIDEKIVSEFSGSTDHCQNKKYIRSLLNAEVDLSDDDDEESSEENAETDDEGDEDNSDDDDEDGPPNVFDPSSTLEILKTAPKIPHEHKDYGVIGKIMSYTMGVEDGQRGNILTKLLQEYANNFSNNESLNGMTYITPNSNNAGLYINDNSELNGKPVKKYTLTMMNIHSSATSYKYESIAEMFGFKREDLSLIEKVNGKNERYYRHNSGVLIDIIVSNKINNYIIATVNLVIYESK